MSTETTEPPGDTAAPAAAVVDTITQRTEAADALYRTLFAEKQRLQQTGETTVDVKFLELALQANDESRLALWQLKLLRDVTENVAAGLLRQSQNMDFARDLLATDDPQQLLNAVLAHSAKAVGGWGDRVQQFAARMQAKKAATTSEPPAEVPGAQDTPQASG